MKYNNSNSFDFTWEAFFSGCNPTSYLNQSGFKSMPWRWMASRKEGFLREIEAVGIGLFITLKILS